MTNRKALVTGASEGIGRSFAQALAQDGYRVTAVARSEPRLADLTSSLSGDGHRSLVADLTDSSAVARVCEDVAETGYDVLVNNAGASAYGPFTEVPLEDLTSTLRLNCDAVLALSHAFLKTAKRGDALVNVASTLAILPFPNNAAYAATKAFVLSLSESLWYEQQERGVYVMALCPGATKTRFLDSVGSDDQRPPEGFLQTPEEVIGEAMAALRARSAPTVVSGIKNGLMVAAARFMPRKGVVSMMGSFTRKPGAR